MQNNMNELFTSLQKMLLPYAIKLTGNYEDAHDLIQDAGLRLLNAKERLESLPLIDQRRIAYTTLKNAFLDSKRRANTRPRFTSDQFPNLAYDNTDPAPRLAAKRIIEFVSTSDDHLMQVLWMFSKGYKTSEIARAMNTTNSSVSGYIRNGRLKLRKLFPDSLN